MRKGTGAREPSIRKKSGDKMEIGKVEDWGNPIGEHETGCGLHRQNDARVVNEDSNGFRYRGGAGNNRFQNNRIKNDRGDHGSDIRKGRNDFANRG
ncbi:hypothetical protein TNIN_441081 [Trichonephila inaurata madagascariensis]|uniref:Uncharacterized protein n=1 Tax=Trichonephila inaurata madagascariensis TaxID=2747483 RepID=A0A8X7BT85_9ARAC|nr:hypothetical protein TNIN_441081 [Trichonephila inaurata madagascariensis]